MAKLKKPWEKEERNGQIRPIPTEYNGYRFRSRLEARWAVVLDALGVEYEYEPEGFELPSGMRYLPDFRVKCWGTRGDHSGPPFDLYIEVKGHMTQGDADRIREFTGARTIDGIPFGIENPVLIVGSIPPMRCATDSGACKSYERMDGVSIFPFNYETIDGDNFAAYPAAHDGRFYLMGDDSNQINNADALLAERAYSCARKARFEYGETPTQRPLQPQLKAHGRKGLMAKLKGATS